MRFKTHGHRHGEIDIPQAQRDELEESLTASPIKMALGNAKLIRDDIIERLTTKGWPPEVEIDPASKISITSLKNRIGLCLQTGNMSRMYADLLKLQTVYLRETITAGILVVPSQRAAKALGDNIASFERLVRELEIFERVITVPLLIVGIED